MANFVSRWFQRRVDRSVNKSDTMRNLTDTVRTLVNAVRIHQPPFADFEEYCAQCGRDRPSAGPTRTLDIGCGDIPRNPFGATELHGVDIREDAAKGIRYGDLTIESIPFPDDHFDYLTAYDFLEHVPRVAYVPARRFVFVELMNEIHRVLKPRGLMLSHTPAYPYAQAFQDPTHVNVITEDTFPLYFDDKTLYARSYGFKGAFEIVKQGWRAPHLITVLRKV